MAIDHKDIMTTLTYVSHFRELRLKVLNLHYTKGSIDDFELDMESFL